MQEGAMTAFTLFTHIAALRVTHSN